MNKLDTWGYFVNGIGLVIGTGQVVAGIGITSASLFSGSIIGVLAGATIILHGANNLQETFINLRCKKNNTDGFLRKGYITTAEFMGFNGKAGRLAFSAVDLALSGYGLGRMVFKPDAWRLFHYISADYIRNFKTAGAPSLALEILGDDITIINSFNTDRII